jgi:hypothetical protein
MLKSLQKITLADGVTAASTGSSFSVERSKGWTFTVASTSTSATVDVQAYIGADWRTIHSEAVTAVGNKVIRDDHGHYEKIRAKVDPIANGAISVFATGTTDSL